RAWQADFRAFSVRKRGGGVLGLSGSVGEVPYEVYNLLHFIDPRILEDAGIKNIEQFVGRYLVIEARYVIKPTGVRELKMAVTGYKNLNELRAIMDTYGSFVSHEQAGIKLPESKELLVEVEMDEAQRAKYDFYRDLARNALEEKKSGSMFAALAKMKEITVHPSLGQGYKWDNALGGLAKTEISEDALEKYLEEGWEVSTELMKAEIRQAPEGQKAKLRAKLNDMNQRFVDEGLVKVEKELPPPPSFESPKFLECARRISEAKHCAHVVFVESTAAHRWLIEVLVKHGIKRDRIEVINGPTKSDVADISDRFNGSEDVPRSLDVVIANVRGARGVNLQRDTCMLHNLDMRWTPGEMEQRRGRIDRYGNTHEFINILFYFAKDSFDSFVFDILAGKGQWRDSLFLREGDRSINPAAQLDLTPGEVMMLTARTPEEGRRLQAAMHQEQEERRLAETGATAVRLFKMAARRLRKSALATSAEETARLRAEADEMIKTLTKIDREAWSWQEAVENLATGDPARVWAVADSPKIPPLHEGMVFEASRFAAVTSAGATEFRKLVTVYQVGSVFGGSIGIRENGTARWMLKPMSTIESAKYSDDVASNAHVTDAAVAKEHHTWWQAHEAWVGEQYAKHRTTIINALKYGPKGWVPVFTKKGLKLELSSHLTEAMNVMPPTAAAFQTFVSWAPMTNVPESTIRELADEWFGRPIEQRVLPAIRVKGKRVTSLAESGCNARVLGMKPPRFTTQIGLEFERLKDLSGIQAVDLGVGAEIDLDVSEMQSPDDLRQAALRYLHHDFAVRWTLLAQAQARHLVDGIVDPVLPEYYDAIERAANRAQRLLGSANAMVLQICAQFVSLDPTVEAPIDHAKLAADQPELAKFVAPATKVRIGDKLGVIPAMANQTVTVRMATLDSDGAVTDESKSVSAKGNLFPLMGSNYFERQAKATVVYLISVGTAPGAEDELVWVHVAPALAGLFVDNYEELRRTR
ncbi:MAG: helicase-related protein, partial [Nannocystaceae bacterium]